MTSLLIKAFIKNKDDIKNPQVRNAYGKLAGITGIVANVFLFVIKLIAGTLLGGVSVSIIADAVNNLADASSSLISLMGFRLSERPADREHPYGHGRYEYVSAFIVTILIMVIGVELLKSGIDKIINPSAVIFSIIAVTTSGKLIGLIYNEQKDEEDVDKSSDELEYN